MWLASLLPDLLQEGEIGLSFDQSDSDPGKERFHSTLEESLLSHHMLYLLRRFFLYYAGFPFVKSKHYLPVKVNINPSIRDC